jgi:hypothetical protein
MAVRAPTRRHPSRHPCRAKAPRSGGTITPLEPKDQVWRGRFGIGGVLATLSLGRYYLFRIE